MSGPDSRARFSASPKFRRHGCLLHCPDRVANLILNAISVSVREQEEEEVRRGREGGGRKERRKEEGRGGGGGRRGGEEKVQNTPWRLIN